MNPDKPEVDWDGDLIGAYERHRPAERRRNGGTALTAGERANMMDVDSRPASVTDAEFADALADLSRPVICKRLRRRPPVVTPPEPGRH